MQFYYCNSDSHSPRSFQSTSPVEFYRTSGAGLWQDAEGLGLPLISALATGAPALRGKLSPTGNGWSILLKSIQRRIFLFLPKRYEAYFRYLVSRPCDSRESQNRNGWQEQAMVANLRLLSFSNTPKIDSAIFHLKLCVFKHMAKGRDICKGLCTHNV